MENCSLLPEGYEFVYVSEQDVGVDEKVDEMLVGIPDEAVHSIVGVDLHICDRVSQDAPQSYSAQGVSVDYGYAGCHFCRFKIIDMTIRTGNISSRPMNISKVNMNFAAVGNAE